MNIYFSNPEQPSPQKVPRLPIVTLEILVASFFIQEAMLEAEVQVRAEGIFTGHWAPPFQLYGKNS